MGPVALLVAALAAFPAHAHTTDAPPAAGSVWAWNFAPWLIALLLVSLLLYVRGVWRLWSHAGWDRVITQATAGSFGAGWLFLVIALVSPLDALGGHLFSAHMVQHELLMVVAAPLLVLGRPLVAWLWAFDLPRRRRIGRAFQSRGWLSVWHLLSDPVVAWGVHAIVLWVWHVPGWFSAALRNEWIHVAQHTTFLASALLFWWAVLGHDVRVGRGTGMAIASLFTTMLHTAALGALLSLAPTPWYEPYIATSQAFGIDPVDDQQLGGLVMWVPAGLAYVVTALALLGRMLARQRV
jgi:putative membrane protein